MVKKFLFMFALLVIVAFSVIPAAFSQTVSIEYGKLVSASIDPVGNIDSYRFVASAGDVILARLTTDVVNYFNPEIRLSGPSGSEIQRVSGDLVAEISCTLNESGTYTIVVMDSAARYTGNYGITITDLIDTDGGITDRPTPSDSPGGVSKILDAKELFGVDVKDAKYIWDFGDQTTLTTSNRTVTHVYAKEGNYTVKLTVNETNSNITQNYSSTINVSTITNTTGNSGWTQPLATIIAALIAAAVALFGIWYNKRGAHQENQNENKNAEAINS